MNTGIGIDPSGTGITGITICEEGIYSFKTRESDFGIEHAMFVQQELNYMFENYGDSFGYFIENVSPIGSFSPSKDLVDLARLLGYLEGGSGKVPKMIWSSKVKKITNRVVRGGCKKYKKRSGEIIKPLCDNCKKETIGPCHYEEGKGGTKGKTIETPLYKGKEKTRHEFDSFVIGKIGVEENGKK